MKFGPKIHRKLFPFFFNCQMGKYALVLLTIFFIVGCTAMKGYPPRPDDVEKRLEVLNSEYFLPGNNVVTTYNNKPDADKKAYRNEVIYFRMLAIDMQYGIFKSSIYEEGIQSNLTSEMGAVLTGVAGAVTTSIDASRILSALSGGISGTQVAVNKNLYYEKTMPALMALMDAERLKVRTLIEAGLAQDVTAYPLGRALLDLENYQTAGSIPGAIASITIVAGERNSEASETLTILRNESWEDPVAQATVDRLLDQVDLLPNGEAWNLINAPPIPLDQTAVSALERRLGGVVQANWSSKLHGNSNDQDARKALKFILLMAQDRSKESLAKWSASMAALIQ